MKHMTTVIIALVVAVVAIAVTFRVAPVKRIVVGA